MTMNYYIRVISKESPAQKFKLEQGETLVGRSRSADIRIKEPDVSGKHFIVRLEGDQLSVENLSSKGIHLDEQMLFENSPVKSGQRIFAGDSLECIIEDEDLSEANDALTFTSAGIGETGGINETAPGAQGSADISHNDTDNVTRGSHNSVHTSDSHNTGDSYHTGNISYHTSDSHNTNDSYNTNDSVNTNDSHNTGDSQNTGDSHNTGDSQNTGGSRDTVAGKTRVATPAEIQYLKEQKKNRVSRLRFVRMVLLVLVCIAVVALFFWRTEKPREQGIWPRKADGKFSSAMAHYPGLGVNEGGFALYYPKFSDTKSEVKGSVITVSTSLGADGDIPFSLRMEVLSGKKFLASTMLDNLKEWMGRRGTSAENRWMFERLSGAEFFGDENGLPSAMVPYVREEGKQTWYGTVRIFRYADRAYILQAEVPFEYRSRTEKTIEKTSFLLFSKKFVQNHWDGGVPAVKANWELLREIKSQLPNASPIRLARMARTVNGLLIDTSLSGDIEKHNFAKELLLLLRNEQNLCYNAMKIRYINARLERNSAAALRIKDESAAIFPLSNDKRYYDIRTNQW